MGGGRGCPEKGRGVGGQGSAPLRRYPWAGKRESSPTDRGKVSGGEEGAPPSAPAGTLAMTGKSVKDVDRYQAVLANLLLEEDNKFCADCQSKGSASSPPPPLAGGRSSSLRAAPGRWSVRVRCFWSLGRPSHPRWQPRAALAAEPAMCSAAPGLVWREVVRASMCVCIGG